MNDLIIPKKNQENQENKRFPFEGQYLDRTYKYRAAIQILGFTNFEAVRTHWRGRRVLHPQFYVNGWPLNLVCHLIKSQLREHRVKFKSSWLKDTLYSMAAEATGFLDSERRDK